MDLSIKQDKRSKKFYQKAPRCGAKKVKAIALRDMKGEFNRNYLQKEYKILEYGAYDFEYINLEI